MGLKRKTTDVLLVSSICLVKNVLTKYQLLPYKLQQTLHKIFIYFFEHHYFWHIFTLSSLRVELLDLLQIKKNCFYFKNIFPILNTSVGNQSWTTLPRSWSSLPNSFLLKVCAQISHVIRSMRGKFKYNFPPNSQHWNKFNLQCFKINWLIFINNIWNKYYILFYFIKVETFLICYNYKDKIFSN